MSSWEVWIWTGGRLIQVAVRKWCVGRVLVITDIVDDYMCMLFRTGMVLLDHCDARILG